MSLPGFVMGLSLLVLAACNAEPGLRSRSSEVVIELADSLGGERAAHTATVLADGKVLLAGGNCDDSSGSSTAEIFDPESRNLRAVGSMIECRYGHTATLLPTGEVLIAGGTDSLGYASYRIQAGHLRFIDYRIHPSVEIFDPDTESFAAGEGMAFARFGHTATSLPDGRVLIVGGASYRRAELYNPDDGKFTSAARTDAVRYNHTATALPDGRVLLAGGGPGGSRSMEIYDPIKDEFAMAGTMLAPRAHHTATLLNDGRVLIVGGMQEFVYEFPSAELYDPSIDGFTAAGSMVVSREGHRATILPDGKVLISGGLDVLGRFPATAIIQPASQVSRDGPAIDSQIVAPMSDSGVLAALEVFEPSGDVFRPAGRMTYNRDGHTVSPLPGGSFLIAGGFGGLDSSKRLKVVKVPEIATWPVQVP